MSVEFCLYIEGKYSLKSVSVCTHSFVRSFVCLFVSLFFFFFSFFIMYYLFIYLLIYLLFQVKDALEYFSTFNGLEELGVKFKLRC